MKKIIVAIQLLALIVSLTACVGATSSVRTSSDSLQPVSQTEAKTKTEKILFPAYNIEDAESTSIQNVVDMVNNTPPFYISVPFEKNWVIKMDKGDETIPSGEFYTPVYIYENDTLIAYIAFCPFLFDFPEDTPKEGAYPFILPNLRLSSQFLWNPYTTVKATENGEVGVVDIEYMDPDDIENHPGAMPEVDRFTTVGIVAYDMNLKVSVAIAFMPDTLDKEQAIKIAEEVSISYANSNK